MQPEKSFLLRVPPWLIGCVIALPIAIGMYVVFKHVLVPLTAASIHKRAVAIGKPILTHKKPSPATMGEKPAELPVHAQVQLLTDRGILQEVNEDFTAFTVTERWYDLSRDDKVALLTQLGAALLASGMTAPFEIKDDSGIPGARVTSRTIELLDRYGFSETIERGDPDGGQQHPAGQDMELPHPLPKLETTGPSSFEPSGKDQ